MKKRDDEGASIVLVMVMIPLVMLIVTPVTLYSATALRNHSKVTSRVGVYSAGTAAPALSNYRTDAVQQIAVNSVRSSVNSPCSSYPKTILGTQVSCVTPAVPSPTQTRTDSPVNPNLTPTLVTTTLTPGQVVPSPVRKTITSPVALLTAASAYECGMTGYPGMTTNITNGTTTSVVTMPAAANRFSQADVGNFIWIASNNGNCGQSGDVYRITAVAGTPTKLTISPKYTSNKTSVNWHMVHAIDPVVTPVLAADPTPNTCPSAIFSASFSRVTPNPSPAVYLYDETLTINPSYAGAYAASYTCTVTFKVYGTDPETGVNRDFLLTEVNVLNILGATNVYFTTKNGSSTLGKTWISYDKRVSGTPITVNSWTVNN